MGGLLLGLLLLAAAPEGKAAAPCPRQPLPHAVDSIGPPPVNHAFNMIEFSAKPSLGLSAWVVRITQETPKGAAMVEAVRLTVRMDCNLYDDDGRITGILSPEQFARFAAIIEPFVRPPLGSLSLREPRGPWESPVDGTAIVLRLTTREWQVTRHRNAAEKEGRAIFEAVDHFLIENAPAARMKNFLPN